MKVTAPKGGRSRLEWFVEHAGEKVTVSQSDAKAFRALIAWCDRMEAITPTLARLQREHTEFRRESSTLRQLLKGAQAAAAKAERRHADATERFAKQCDALKK